MKGNVQINSLLTSKLALQQSYQINVSVYLYVTSFEILLLKGSIGNQSIV